MSLARKEEKPIVYIGFGSIVVPDPRAMTKNIIKAVLKSCVIAFIPFSSMLYKREADLSFGFEFYFVIGDVRAIVSKGWSARMAKDTGEPEIEMPPECYSVSPHTYTHY